MQNVNSELWILSIYLAILTFFSELWDKKVAILYFVTKMGFHIKLTKNAKMLKNKQEKKELEPYKKNNTQMHK